MGKKTSTYPAKIEVFLDRDNWMRLMLASSMRPQVKVVVACIALYLNVDDGQCNPMVKTIGAGTNYSKRHVLRLLPEAEAAGWIKIKRSEGEENDYELMVPADVEQAEPVTSDVTGDIREGGGSGGILRGDRCHFEGGPVTSDVTIMNSGTAEQRGDISPGRAKKGLHDPTRKGGRKKDAPPDGVARYSDAAIEEGFTRFMAVYPNGDDPLAAKKAFRRALKNGAAVEQLINHAKHYADERRRIIAHEPGQAQYTMKAKNWLADGAWANPISNAPILDHATGNPIATPRSYSNSGGSWAEDVELLRAHFRAGTFGNQWRSQ